MDTMELIETRKSVRTFDGRPLAAEDRVKLADYIQGIPNPYGIPVKLMLLDAEEHDLSSPVIRGEHLYVAGTVKRQPHGEEAFGYSFEKLVLYAWSLGIGTTWIGGTLDRPHFEQVIGLEESERMYAVSPLGYPAKEPSEVDATLRERVHGDERLPESELFFDGAFGNPLVTEDAMLADALRAVRWAPSAVNGQPWRIVREGNAFHFFEKHTRKPDPADYGDVQKIDMGIALCHFLTVAGGELVVEDPGIEHAQDVEYIATVRV